MIRPRNLVLMLTVGFLAGGHVTAQPLKSEPAVPSTVAPPSPPPGAAISGGTAYPQPWGAGGLTITQSAVPAAEKDDWLAGCAAVVAALGAFAWPAALLFGIYIARKQVVALVSNIAQLKYGELSVDFQARRVNQAMVKVSENGVVAPADIEAIFEAVKTNDWATLIMARMLMRRGLMAIVGARIGPNPSLEKMLPKAMPVLGETLVADLERLRLVSYYAEWWLKDPPSIRDWHWSVDNARRLIDELFRKIPLL